MKSVITFIAILLTFCFRIAAQETVIPPKASPDVLRIHSWNIKMLPRLILRVNEDPLTRVRLMPEKMIRDSMDVIVFQEAFDKRARRILKRRLKETYPYIVGPANYKPWGLRTNSGVMMFSKIPIKHLGETAFSECEGSDCYARKGALLVEAEWKGTVVQILGTHLEAGGTQEMKKKQYFETSELINRHQKSGVPQILCGDFNTSKDDPELYPAMLQTLDVEDSALSGELQFTADEVLCDMNIPGKNREPHRKVIDYILYRSNGLQPKSMQRFVIQYESQWHPDFKDLSDHFGVMMEVVF